MPKVVYLCKEENSNKFWAYETSGDKAVTITWGRVGLAGDTQSKSFGTPWERDNFIQGKVREKEKKGYKLSDTASLAVEAEVARELGHQYKVKRVEYVARKGDRLNVLLGYDPGESVMVELLNSWTKESIHFLLKGAGSKAENYLIDGFSENKSARVIDCAEIRTVVGELLERANGVRSYMKKLQSKVTEAVKKVVAGTFGRKLMVDNIEKEESTDILGDSSAVAVDSTSAAFYDAIDDKGASKQVIAKFAGLGARKLML